MCFSMIYRFYRHYSVIPLSALFFLSIIVCGSEVSSTTNDNIVLIEYTGSNYDAVISGSLNTSDRMNVGHSFYQSHGDVYDFLCILTTFPVDLSDPNHQDVAGKYFGVSNSVSGIGQQIYDNCALFGSEGRLKGYIDLGQAVPDTLNPYSVDFQERLDTLIHELSHQWLARVGSSLGLLTDDNAHWNYYLHTDGSYMYGGEWEELEPGVFTCSSSRRRYSELDLYLIGLLDKSEVSPFFLITPDSYAPPQYYPLPGDVVQGSKNAITVDEIITLEGEREPASLYTQKEFRMAFILLSDSTHTVTEELVSGINNLRENLVLEFFRKTGGRALIETRILDIPAVIEPISELNVDLAHEWLLQKQQPNGSWFDNENVAIRDTQTVLHYLYRYEPDLLHALHGMDYINIQSPTNNDYISRIMMAYADAGEETEILSGLLADYQNPDGGWSVNGRFESTALDSALVLKALNTTGNQDLEQQLTMALTWFKEQKDSNGNWKFLVYHQSIDTVLTIVEALEPFHDDPIISELIADSEIWLMTFISDDGGLGKGISSISQSARFLKLSEKLSLPPDMINDLVIFLASKQESNGSWSNSIYNTALAVEALRNFLRPDISVNSADVFLTDNNFCVGFPTEIRVLIQNIGRQDAEHIKISVYLSSDGTVIGEENNLNLIAGESQTLIFDFVPTASGDDTIIIQCDPLNVIHESCESNNKAEKFISVVIAPQTAELSVNGKSYTFLPNSLQAIPQYQEISVQVRNYGSIEAEDVTIKLYEGDPEQGGMLVGEQSLTMPALSINTVDFSFSIDRIGSSMYHVVINPEQTIIEQDYGIMHSVIYQLQ